MQGGGNIRAKQYLSHNFPTEKTLTVLADHITAKEWGFKCRDTNLMKASLQVELHSMFVETKMKMNSGDESELAYSLNSQLMRHNYVQNLRPIII